MAYDALKRKLQAQPGSWLISGIAGFIGSNLLQALLQLDQRVLGLDNFFSGHRDNLQEVQSRVKADQWSRFSLVEGDIRNLSICRQVCSGRDYVLHQAAMCSVPGSIQD